MDKTDLSYAITHLETTDSSGKKLLQQLLDHLSDEPDSKGYKEGQTQGSALWRLGKTKDGMVVWLGVGRE